MSQDNISAFYKFAVIAIGGICLTTAFVNLPRDIFGWNFFFLLTFTLLITPLMSIQLPRVKFVLSFSDSIIFLAFICIDKLS